MLPSAVARSLCLWTTCDGIPLRRNTSAVPVVATMVNPRSARRFTGKIIARLSRLATDTKIRPSRGRPDPAASMPLANAVPKSSSMPMTSPVERISGPSRLSTTCPSRVRNRWNGSTASLTATGAWLGIVPPSPNAGSMPSARSSLMVAPSMTRAAALATGTPVALATNGTVREARGLASRT